MFNITQLRKLAVSFPRSHVRLFSASVARSQTLVHHEADFEAESRKQMTIEGHQGEIKSFSYQDARKALEEAVDYSVHGPSVQGIQGGHDDLVDVLYNAPVSEQVHGITDHNTEAFNCHNNLDLHGCMQSNVPEPFSTSFEHYESPNNLPGNGRLLLQKYVSDAISDMHPSRKFHTTSHHYGLNTQRYSDDEFDETPSPQGIQGDECTLELWMENCMRYNLPNCKEQLKNIKEGRKTLSQVFAEQDLLIRQIAESYKEKREITGKSNIDFEASTIDAETPSPQGIQGDDCVRFRLWLENCQRFSLGECEEQIQGIKTGRKTLAEVFAEQDTTIRSIVSNYYQKRSYSTSSKPEVRTDLDSQSNPVKLSNKDRLKRAVKEYGSTVIVFHVGISLISLGGFYLAVSSGIDMVSLLTKIGVGEQLLQSKLATGASTFVVAYAVHKVFAPVRIGITLTSVPFVVRYLRKIGFLKPPKNL